MNNDIGPGNNRTHEADNLAVKWGNITGVYKATIYVEGGTDIVFWRNLLDIDKCNLYPKDGKLIVIKAVNDATENQVLGIIDKDYSEFEPPLPKNIITTDYNDLETQILSTEILDNFLDDNCDLSVRKIMEKKWNCSTKQHILEICTLLGIVRYSNQKEKINIPLSKKKNPILSTLILDEDLNFCVTAYLQKVISRYNNKPETVENNNQLDIHKVMKLINNNLPNNTIDWPVIKGHDLIALLSLFIWTERTPNIGNNKIPALHLRRKNESFENYSKNVASHIINLYTRDHLVKSKMFERIISWQEEHIKNHNISCQFIDGTCD